MSKDLSFNLLVVAAGKGSRFGSDTPKQYCYLGGKMVCEHTLDVFSKIEGLKRIVMVVNPAHEMHYAPLKNIFPQIDFCLGGVERNESVYNGLSFLDQIDSKETVLIHDAARPFVTQGDINSLLEVLKDKPAASLCAPIIDSIRYVDDRINAGDVLDRDAVRAVQTPQGFDFECIMSAHNWAKSQIDQKFTDDTSVVTACGGQVTLIDASPNNFKITTQQDWERAQAMTQNDNEIRVGQGFDVHAFDDCEAKYVTLCGVEIPYERKLKGHSDADVGLHTLTDAIYGALGAGDIGQHFPPSDMTFKDMDSAVFLEHAMGVVRERGGHVVNADVTLICEAPKIGSYRDQIIARMAEIMNVSPSRLNIKATTTEKLGFTGRGEGIAAQAVVSISLPASE